MTRPFVHLHLHTQYSLLDGVNKIPDVLEQAHNLGQPAIAMTDHGNMHGAVDFYLAAKKAGIKPIIGCEIYVTPGSRFDRRQRSQGGPPTHHLTVLAKDLTGYRNLCKVVSRAYREGFYFKPRADHEVLREHAEGLIVLSGCLNGELNAAASRDDIEGARALMEFYATTFPGRYYLEVQPHAIPEQRKLNQACIELAKGMGLPLVATTDCHYPSRDDHYAQEVLMCVATGKQVTDPDRLRHEGVYLHLKSGDEMLEEFGGGSVAEEAIGNSVAIAAQCEVEFSFKTYYMPQFTPENDERPLIEIMAQNAREGLEARLDQLKSRSSDLNAAMVQRYRERLEFEIALIDKMGFAGYFLVVSDFIVWAKEHGVPVGPGRGSVAGSLVAFALRITEVDPIANKLLFERFLNPERVSLPDIDVDFCMNGRDRVIEYVVSKYGKDKVAQIATFGTLKAKAAIKDVGRALGLSYAETDRIAQLIPAPRQGFDYPLSEALKMEPRLTEYAQGEGKQLVSLALKLEGLTRHASTHAAGVVIGDRPLIELLPMMVDKDGHDVTQYDMTAVEKIGLVKFDFLGLKTLTVLHTAKSLIAEGRGVEVDLNALPLEDPKTYAMLGAGNTVGVFQLESSGITEMTMRLKPNCFDDLVAILALYRPGPLDAGMVDHYVNRKHGREAVTYSHPAMKNVLSDTYGIMLYQEQIMQLARELAGYSLGEADLLRKAMGKKIPEEMAKQRTRFVEGAKERKVPERLANEIFDQMETFARYGFNRSHSAAYALVSFQTAFLKAHYPVEFLAALLTHETDDSDKVLKNLSECRKQKVQVLPPDVNQSVLNFSVAEGKIRFGLGAVKGIGEKAVEEILRARGEGPFRDIEDFMKRVDPRLANRRVVESLIKCGAFDTFGESRRSMFERLDDLVKYSQALHREDDGIQVSLFGDTVAVVAPPRRRQEVAEWPVNQKLSFEREALGLYISGHPLEKFRADLKRLGAISTLEVKRGNSKQEVRVGGVVTALKLRNTKKGDRYASFVLEDDVSTVETIVWPDTYQQVQALLASDSPVVISGRADVSDERAVLIANKVESLTAVRDTRATHGLLTLKDNDDFEARLQTLIQLLGKHRGTCPVKVRIEMGTADVSLVLRDQKNSPVTVLPSEALCDAVEQLFGRPVLTFL
ncbi:MAG: DNA polymerase III subunit alpha [Bdellovibrionota bacterium]|nr:MAG: DNA polymerase III subunit alpha [Bdellovibrionota bacterium]